jgi:DNA-binding MurR/RpiR family transcriptional regulator
MLIVLCAKMSTPRSGERKVANVIMERPNEIRQLSILDLAERSGVGEAMTMRLGHALGCRGYSDFTVRLIEDLAVSQAAGARLAGETHAPSRVRPPTAGAQRLARGPTPKETLTNHHAAITALDEQLGRIMAHLESHHLAGDPSSALPPTMATCCGRTA